MRKTFMLAVLATGVAGCGFFRKTLGVGDTAPAHTSPTTTSIWGDWVLASAPDSTAFVGASNVEMRLDQSAFTITANYRTRPSVTVRGLVSQPEAGGLVTLDPQSGLEGVGGGGTFGWTPGERVSVVASAAGNTLVFAPPRDNLARPSSVWHRKEAAKKAGTAPPPR